MVDWTTGTKRDLDRLLGLASTNPFVTIKGPGSADGQKSAASSCEVGFEMKAKRAMNKTAELLRDFLCRSMHFGAILFAEPVGLVEMLEILRKFGRSGKIRARDPFPPAGALSGVSIVVFARAVDDLVSMQRSDSVRMARSVGFVVSAKVGATPKPRDRTASSCDPAKSISVALVYPRQRTAGS